MKKVKKILRLVALVCLMLLASAGIGITGAAPVSSRNKETFIDNEPKTELVENRQDQPGGVNLNDVIR